MHSTVPKRFSPGSVLLAVVAVAASLIFAGPAKATSAVLGPNDPDPSMTVRRASGLAADTHELPCADNGPTKAMSRDDAVNRARSWLGVTPYSKERCYPNQYGDYRTDCSGMVAMAWGLGGSGSQWWTGNLDSVSTPIAAADLQPGDALLYSVGDQHLDHVALFERWYDSTHTKPVVIQETGSADNTIEGVPTNFTWTKYTPIRYDKITDSAFGVEDPLVSQPGGDFNGDGRDDGVILYHHTDGSISVHTSLTDSGGGFGPYTVGYTVPAGSWDWNAFRTIAGDFNGDGRSDLAIMYHHADSTISMHTSLADSTGHLGRFTVSYTVPANSWDFNALRLVSGDFNGDGRDDGVILYHHTDGSISVHTSLTDSGGGFGPYTVGYTVPAGSWDWNAFRTIAGDFNGDGRSDLAIMYHHADSTISMHTSLADSTGHLGRFTVSYTVPANSWDYNALRLL
jgi:hypothetical protein